MADKLPKRNRMTGFYRVSAVYFFHPAGLHLRITDCHEHHCGRLVQPRAIDNDRPPRSGGLILYLQFKKAFKSPQDLNFFGHNDAFFGNDL
jgi:hypothetical protein